MTDVPHCKALVLTRREARMLITAAGSSLERTTKLLAGGVITGEEVHRRIALWNGILDKLNTCLESGED